MSTHRKNLKSPWLFACTFLILTTFVLAVLCFAGIVPVYSGIASVLLAFLTFKVWDKETGNSDYTWGAGARAERQVGDELDHLHTVGFHVFHDVHSGSEGEGNVDHLIIGREGVFAIETKSWQGIITSKVRMSREAAGRGECRGRTELQRNGRWLRYCDPLSQARWGAAKVSEMIGESMSGCSPKNRIARKPYVIPVVCFSRADIRLYGKTNGVEVCEIGALKRVILHGRKKCYTKDQVSVMAEYIEEQIGFSPASAPGSPPEEPSRTSRFMRWFFGLPSLCISLTFVFLMSLVFPGQFSEVLEAFSSLYGVLSDIYGYFLF